LKKLQKLELLSLQNKRGAKMSIAYGQPKSVQKSSVPKAELPWQHTAWYQAIFPGRECSSLGTSHFQETNSKHKNLTIKDLGVLKLSIAPMFRV